MVGVTTDDPTRGSRHPKRQRGRTRLCDLCVDRFTMAIACFGKPSHQIHAPEGMSRCYTSPTSRARTEITALHRSSHWRTTQRGGYRRRTWHTSQGSHLRRRLPFRIPLRPQRALGDSSRHGPFGRASAPRPGTRGRQLPIRHRRGPAAPQAGHRPPAEIECQDERSAPRRPPIEHLEKTFSSTRNRLKDARRDLRSADSPQLAKRADSPERQDFADDRGDRGCRLMVRHGYHHLWKVTTADGAAEVRAPQVHDRRVDETRSPRLR